MSTSGRRRDLVPVTGGPLVIAAICAGLLVAVPGVAGAQSSRTENTLVLDDPANMPAATLADLAWLVGDWEGEGFGGTFEETWRPPTDGTMVGTYRLMRDGTTFLYEIEWIVEEEGSLVLKVKHFGADLVAWEEKDGFESFPLVKITEDAVYFAGFTLRRVDEDTLLGYIVASGASGIREVELSFRRVTTKR